MARDRGSKIEDRGAPDGAAAGGWGAPDGAAGIGIGIESA